jgi:hypothetical protein
MSKVVGSTSISPIRRGFAANFVKYKKGCTRLAAANDKAYQLLAQDRWFSPGTPASSTSKTGRHDIAEILLKVALNTKNSNSKYYLMKVYLKGVYNISYNSCSFDAVLSLKCIHVYAYGHPLTLTFRIPKFKLNNGNTF